MSCSDTRAAYRRGARDQAERARALADGASWEAPRGRATRGLGASPYGRQALEKWHFPGGAGVYHEPI